MIRSLPLLPALLASLLAAAAGGASAQDMAIAEPLAGELVAGRALIDPDFGVRADALGLERRVRMYQWRRRDDGGYEAVWSGQPIPSDDHDAAHANPPWPTFATARWLNEHAVLNGRTVDSALFATLDGWEPLAVDAAQLAPNLAVVFQPDGRGLTSSATAASPEVGDLRLRWFALHGGPVYGRAIERAGRWTTADANHAGLQRGEAPGEGDATELPGLPRDPRFKMIWLAWAGGALALLLLAMLYSRRKN